MTAIPPCSEAPQPAGLLPAIIKAAVIDVVSDAARSAPVTRLTGVVVGTPEGQMQIRSAGSVVTIAPTDGLEDGMAVALTLLRRGDSVIARIQPAAIPSRPLVPNAATAAPQPASTPPVPVVSAVPAVPTATSASAPAPQTLLSAIPRPQAPPASAVSSNGTMLAVPAPTIVPTTMPASAPPSNGEGRALPLANSTTDGNRTALVAAPPADMSAASVYSGSPASPARSSTVVSANQPIGGPGAGGAVDRTVPPAAAPAVSAALPGRDHSGGSRPLPPVDPSTLLELLQTMIEDPVIGRTAPVSAPVDPAAKSPRLDLNRFAHALAGLVETHPSLARSLLATAIPQPDKRLGKVLSAFVAALGRGDPSAWLGPELGKALSTTEPAFADRLAAMVDDRAHSASTSQGGWRVADLPLVTPTGLLPMRVMVEEEHPDDRRADQPEAPTDAPTRVVVECTLSRFDRIQIDALVRKPQRCDAIVRSETPLPRDVQAMILRAFASVGELTGNGGGVTFQSAPAGFVEPSPLARAGSGVHLSA